MLVSLVMYTIITIICYKSWPGTTAVYSESDVVINVFKLYLYLMCTYLCLSVCCPKSGIKEAQAIRAPLHGNLCSYRFSAVSYI